MKLMVTTQYRENYGACDWDGTGACPQYWKNKGGVDYFLSLGSVFNPDTIDQLITKVAARVERWNNYVEEYIVNWSIEADDYLTPFEKDQLEYEGEIKYPAKEVIL